MRFRINVIANDLSRRGATIISAIGMHVLLTFKHFSAGKKYIKGFGNYRNLAMHRSVDSDMESSGSRVSYSR